MEDVGNRSLRAVGPAVCLLGSERFLEGVLQEGALSRVPGRLWQSYAVPRQVSDVPARQEPSLRARAVGLLLRQEGLEAGEQLWSGTSQVSVPRGLLPLAPVPRACQQAEAVSTTAPGWRRGRSLFPQPWASAASGAPRRGERKSSSWTPGKTPQRDPPPCPGCSAPALGAQATWAPR